MITKAGTVAVIGRPNVGKSTLCNALCGEKISIVSPKPQTTRNRISAVFAEGDTQVVLLDTPGFHVPRTRLGENMVKSIRDSVSGVDLVLLVVSPHNEPGELEKELIQKIKGTGAPAFLVINKVDETEKDALLPIIAAYGEMYGFKDIVPVSALKKDGVALLKSLILPLMPKSAELFPAGVSTDQTDRFFVSEIIREKVLWYMRDEIPHGVAVTVDKLSEAKGGLVVVEATIYCEKNTHKGMLIGKNGEMLKRIGMSARKELEEIYEGKVLLNLWVKVKENWRDSANGMGQMGY